MCASAAVMVVMLDTLCSEVECKTTGYPLHSNVSPSLPLPCVTVCHQVSTELYYRWGRLNTTVCVEFTDVLNLQQPIPNESEMIRRTAGFFQTISQLLFRRATSSFIAEGGHFENFILIIKRLKIRKPLFREPTFTRFFLYCAVGVSCIW